MGVKRDGLSPHKVLLLKWFPTAQHKAKLSSLCQFEVCERFFQELKSSGRILGTRCQDCNLIYAPPRLYCERCLADLSDSWQEVPGQGRVHAYTAAYYDLSGIQLETPDIVAVIQLDGTHGGIIHRIEGIDVGSVEIGLEVEVSLKPPSQRKGSITDIRCFRPVKPN